MIYLKEIEETVDMLLTYEKALSSFSKRDDLSLEKETLQKSVESLTARLSFLLEKGALRSSYRLQNKAHTLKKIASTKKLHTLLTTLEPKVTLRKARFKKLSIPQRKIRFS